MEQNLNDIFNDFNFTQPQFNTPLNTNNTNNTNNLLIRLQTQKGYGNTLRE